MSSTTKRNRQRGKAHQAAVAELLDGLNLGTLGKVDVLRRDYAIECKSRKKFVGTGWMKQAEKHAKKFGNTPIVVVHRTNTRYTSDLVILRMKDFLALLEKTDEKD